MSHSQPKYSPDFFSTLRFLHQPLVRLALVKAKQNRRLRLRHLPVVLLVAVELGQRELLQLDLQVLVLALQVHDHAVQEVDLTGEEKTRVRTDNPHRATDSRAVGRPYLAFSELLLFPQLLQSCVSCRGSATNPVRRINGNDS